MWRKLWAVMRSLSYPAATSISFNMLLIVVAAILPSLLRLLVEVKSGLFGVGLALLTLKYSFNANILSFHRVVVNDFL